MTTTPTTTAMTVKISVNEKGSPTGKLADAELHFSDGPLAGLKLIGFAIWEPRGGARNVTFPARQYSVNGERRSFALLRPIVDTAAQEAIRALILAEYAEHEAHAQRTTPPRRHGGTGRTNDSGLAVPDQSGPPPGAIAAISRAGGARAVTVGCTACRRCAAV